MYLNYTFSYKIPFEQFSAKLLFAEISLLLCIADKFKGI